MCVECVYMCCVYVYMYVSVPVETHAKSVQYDISVTCTSYYSNLRVHEECSFSGLACLLPVCGKLFLKLSYHCTVATVRMC